MAGSGVTCGRPSRRTVDSQNISACDKTAATSAHGRAAAPGSLNPSFSSAAGSAWVISVLLYRDCVIAVVGWTPRPRGIHRARGRCGAGPALGHRTRRARTAGTGSRRGPGIRQYHHMTELTDVSGAFGYGDSILVGERVRLRGVRDDDLPTLAKWEMDSGRTATLSSRVAPPSEASAKEFIAKSSTNEKDDLGFAIETLDDPPLLVGFVGLWGARLKDRSAELGIALGREYIGRGYGSDATRVMVDYGFREMGLHRIQLSVISFNPAFS